MWQRVHRLCLFLAMLLLPASLCAQVGCTDPQASNYNAAATQNDGSCTYPATTVTTSTVVQLADTIEETSGLLYWNGAFWTHNDDTDTTLYAIDTLTGHIVKRIRIAGAANNDWEELTQDDSYFYIGDFGNNGNGNRRDLTVLRIPKTALLMGQNTITPDKIFFSYSDQTDFTPTGNNNTDFDCEAFIATADSLYLFTKQWVSGKSKLYALPKTPGTYVVSPQAEYDVDGMVTGATFLPSKRVIALSGYKIAGLTFQPFIYLLYDYSGAHVFSGNKRRLLLNQPYHQIEGLATIDGKQFFLTNEKLSSVITIPAKLLKADLTLYLSNWYSSLGMAGPGRTVDSVVFYPNPATRQFYTHVRSGVSSVLKAEVYNEGGAAVAVRNYPLKQGDNRIAIEQDASWPAGIYFVRLTSDGKTAWGRIQLY